MGNKKIYKKYLTVIQPSNGKIWFLLIALCLIVCLRFFTSVNVRFNDYAILSQELMLSQELFIHVSDILSSFLNVLYGILVVTIWIKKFLEASDWFDLSAQGSEEDI